MRTGYCRLKSTVVQDTQPKYELCLVNETPTDYLLHCNKFETERAKLMKNISKSLSFQSTEESLGEHNFNTEDSKTVRVELEKNFDSTTKEIWN